jgi:hypothetical protein
MTAGVPTLCFQQFGGVSDEAGVDQVELTRDAEQRLLGVRFDGGAITHAAVVQVFDVIGNAPGQRYCDQSSLAIASSDDEVFGRSRVGDSSLLRVLA